MANLRKIRIELQSYLEELFSKCTFDYVIEDNGVEANASIDINGVANDVYVSYSLDEEGFAFLSYIFDKVQDNDTVYMLVNELNNSSTFVRFYINSNNSLCANYALTETTIEAFLASINLTSSIILDLADNFAFKQLKRYFLD